MKALLSKASTIWYMPFFAGAIGALALAPVNFFPAAILSLCYLFWVIDQASPKKAFWSGYLFGLGYFTAGLWWIAHALLIPPYTFIWALPLAVLGLPLLLAFFTALGCLIAKALWSTSFLRLFAFAFGLGLSEYLRAITFTGFPWNEWGMALLTPLPFAQTASLIGLHGLTFLVFCLFALPALAWSPFKREQPIKIIPLVGTILAFCALFTFGSWRLMQERPNMVPDLHLRIVQPNIENPEANPYFTYGNRFQLINDYLYLSKMPDRKPNTLFIWPETPFPFIFTLEHNIRSSIAQRLNPHQALITGALRATPKGDSTFRYFNSVHVMDSLGFVSQTYDKQHLVPFGEYVPFSWLLHKFGINKFVNIPGDFETGVTRDLLRIPGFPSALPLICYESIFPDEVITLTDTHPRPDYLLNITDDAWFGHTAGPYQHFAQSRLRAIEHGLPLVSASNSGISGVVTPYGRVIASLGIGEINALDTSLPQPIPAPLFAHFPKSIPLVLLGLLGLLALLGKFLRQT